MDDLTPELLHSLFRYEDGKLLWKVSHNQRIKIGSEAGTIDARGYRVVKFNGIVQKAHRVIFMMHHGFMPDYIDHVDGNRLNNKIENLRQATVQQNNHNASIRKDNKSGAKNVNWSNRLNKWIVQISCDGKKKHIGCFEDLELADLVAQEARNKYHKEFAYNG